jgi:hypothetical protein
MAVNLSDKNFREKVRKFFIGASCLLMVGGAASAFLLIKSRGIKADENGLVRFLIMSSIFGFFLFAGITRKD